jgi:hypothetical protein
MPRGIFYPLQCSNFTDLTNCIQLYSMNNLFLIIAIVLILVLLGAILAVAISGRRSLQLLKNHVRFEIGSSIQLLGSEKQVPKP